MVGFDYWISQNDFINLSPKNVQNMIKATNSILSKTEEQKPALYLFEFEKPSETKTITDNELVIINKDKK
ncbi:hypothetical protein [Neobacillus ginsengisoli]|uniref:Uncharacterized protein n=1 Tax=Neobacillus ginsengisoli TaxID=904295 RepID=A0ABT9Y004_9BACI|nr:hypothetical protein [Neobacillus ginsengisoli]MDQ0201071.1 hypothetical protein [Neobacillus ginsengisoli]